MTNRIDPPRKIYVAPSKMLSAGRGVFAADRISEGELIEACPTIGLHDPHDRKRLRKTELVSYYFLWGEDRNRVALCLGFGSIYNHSFSPNARYEKMMDDGRMDFYALRNIDPNEEITVNYNGTPDDMRRLRVPGIPPEAGGPLPSKHPRFVEAILRRTRLAWALLSGK